MTGRTTLALATLGALAAAVPASAGIVRLTGWWSNPTPNNASLLVGHIEYVVSEQGRDAADGDWPRFPRARYVRTNAGSYGYGCARLRVAVEGTRVTRIYSSETLPLRRCRTSIALRRAEPSIK